MCIDAAGFEQQADTGFLGGRFQLGKIAANHRLIVLQRTGNHIGHMGIPGHLHQVFQNRNTFLSLGQVHGGVKTGDCQFQIPQLPYGGCHLMLVKGTAFFQHRVKFWQIIYLNAGKTHIKGGFDHIIPA